MEKPTTDPKIVAAILTNGLLAAYGAHAAANKFGPHDPKDAVRIYRDVLDQLKQLPSPYKP